MASEDNAVVVIGGNGGKKLTREQSRARVVEEQQAAFLERFSECGSILQAAQEVGISRGLHYIWLVECEGYKQRFLEAKKQAVDALEARVFQRANVESDRLAEFLLRGLRPETYGDRFRAEMVGKDGGAIEQKTELTVKFVGPEVESIDGKG